MGFIKLNEEIIEREELDRKNFVKSVEKYLQKYKGKKMIIQGFTQEGFPSLYFGKYAEIGQSSEGHCLELEDDLLFYFNKGNLTSHAPEDEVSLISTTNDYSTIARIIGQKGEIIYGDSEMINEWDKKFNQNGYTRFLDKKVKSNVIKKIAEEYGFNF